MKKMNFAFLHYIMENMLILEMVIIPFKNLVIENLI